MVDWHVSKVVADPQGVRDVLKSDYISSEIMNRWATPLAASVNAEAEVYEKDPERNKIRISKTGTNVTKLMIEEANSGDLFGVLAAIAGNGNIDPQDAQRVLQERIDRRRRRGKKGHA